MDGPPRLIATPTPRVIDDGLTLVTPISRRGYGPGLIVLVSEASKGLYIDDGVPSPLQKWAEEGYTVVEATPSASNVVAKAVEALKATKQCEPSNIGIVAYDVALWNRIAPEIKQIAAAVVYGDADIASPVPVLVHIAGKANRKLVKDGHRTEYDYPAQSSGFASPRTANFEYAAEAVSHTRNLTHLKKLMNGPYFDLEAIWDEHTYYEFEVRDVQATMNTMVQEPYVNHIPTLTGGVGRKDLTDFYQNHFVFSNPADTELELISRTVGVDRVVDEFIFKLTHDRVIDWLLPGIPPSGKYIEIPFMAVVNIRGDRLYHEHITWDHATALRQVGLLPETLPLKAANGHSNGHSEVIVLPVAGNDTAAKLRDKNAVKSNLMFSQAGPRTL